MNQDSVLFPSIPASTVRAARALYGQGNLYLRLGDRLNHLASKFDSERNFTHLRRDKTALLALLTIIQYAEKLTDAELAESIEQRMELRYALHLSTPSHRIDPVSLCVFRSKILLDPQYRGLFDEIFKNIYPEITATAMKEEPDVDDVLNSICEHEIDASLMEAMLRSVETLSANHFNWLLGIALPHWYQRYNRSLLSPNKDSSFHKQELSRDEILGDIQHLLHEIHASNSHDIMEMPETKTLSLIWERLSDPKSRKNCSLCIKQVH